MRKEREYTQNKVSYLPFFVLWHCVHLILPLPLLFHSCNNRKVTLALQKFVRERRVSRERTVAKDVLEFLKVTHLITYDHTNRNRCVAALRSVKRYVKRLG